MPLTRQSRVILAEMDRDPEWWDGVFDRVACGDRLKDIAAEYCVLAGQMSLWIEGRPELARRYGEAMRASGNLVAEDVIPIADGEMPPAEGWSRASRGTGCGWRRGNGWPNAGTANGMASARTWR